MKQDRHEWLALTLEEPLDADLPICDTHHHLWDGRAKQAPDDRYLLAEFLRDAGSGHRVVSTVFVDCNSMYRRDGPEELKPVGETEFVQGIAAMSASGQYGPTRVAAGIIGHADITMGAAVEPVVAAHVAASPNRFRGVRASVHWHADPTLRSGRGRSPQGLLLDRTFREGAAVVAKHGLVLEIAQFYTQLPELAQFARALPDLTIVLNHVGGLIGVGRYAGRHAEVFAEWKRLIPDAAACPNVVVKLGGLGNERVGYGWNEREKPPGSAELAGIMGPWFLYCIEKFGADRCMFESNFPIDKPSFSYPVIWNAFKRVTRGCTPGERAALFHDTAARVYRLEAAPS